MRLVEIDLPVQRRMQKVPGDQHFAGDFGPAVLRRPERIVSEKEKQRDNRKEPEKQLVPAGRPRQFLVQMVVHTLS